MYLFMKNAKMQSVYIFFLRKCRVLKILIAIHYITLSVLKLLKGQMEGYFFLESENYQNPEIKVGFTKSQCLHHLGFLSQAEGQIPCKHLVSTCRKQNEVIQN